MKKHEMRYRFEQLATSEPNQYRLYVYDEVRAAGEFNWSTWSYEDSETSAKYFREKLDEIPNGAKIELHVNSAGGEVGEGVAIYNLLIHKKRSGSKLIGYVDGMAYSVAMDIIMACDEIHMGLGTSMFLHNPWSYVAGNAEELRAAADQLDALTDASVQLYMSRAKNLKEEELRAMMSKETMLAPDSCLKYGFCDFVGEKAQEEPEELEEEPEEITDDPEDNPEDTEDDDLEKEPEKEEQVRQLREQLYRERQINQMLRGIGKASMKQTFSAALQQLGNK